MTEKYALLLYDEFSIQEVSLLTSALSLWHEKQLVTFSSKNTPVFSEEGFRVIPHKTLNEFHHQEYSLLILPGTIYPHKALLDKILVDFLTTLKDKDLLIASISSSPLLLAKAGLLETVRFTFGVWQEIAEYFTFVPLHNREFEPVVYDKNIITAVGFAYREFTLTTLKALGFDPPEDMFLPKKNKYTEEDLTFYMGEEGFKGFLDLYEREKNERCL